MRRCALLMLTVLVGPGARAADEPEIYRCLQDDGTVAFQQMPCRPAKVPQADTRDADVLENDAKADDRSAATGVDGVTSRPGAQSIPNITTAEESAAEAGRPPVPMSGDRADCEKSARDAIDAIDAELQASADTDNDRARLDELLELTRQLRLCRQL